MKEMRFSVSVSSPTALEANDDGTMLACDSVAGVFYIHFPTRIEALDWFNAGIEVLKAAA